MTGKHPKRNLRPGVDGLGRTELHYAASDGDVAKIRDLLSAGANPSTADDNGWTPLHFACQSNAADAVRALLAAGAAIDPADSHGNTPLFRAVFNSIGNGEIISLLRSAGADPAIKNAHGNSPLSLARTIANCNVRQFFDDIPEQP
jgi:uncharacterized protein